MTERPSTVFLDIETQRLADEVGGWSNVSKLGVAVAVTYSTADSAFHHFAEGQVPDLIDQLETADLIVGFNLLCFDYEVLRPHTDVDLRQLPTVDMLQDIYRQLGFRVGLGALASATLGSSKLADGIQAVKWYREGRIDDVLRHCQRDVVVTRDLYAFGRDKKYVQFRDKRRRLRKVSVNW
jgi:DEAD/DEAH box helicase domain-containing protein